MCSGRVDRNFVLEASRLGAGMVLIDACHLPYDCYYISRNYKMKARTDTLKAMLTKLGVSAERLRVEYVSAAEGVHYAELIREIDPQRKVLGLQKIKAEKTKLRPIIENMLRRKKLATLPLIFSVQNVCLPSLSEQNHRAIEIC